MKIQQAVLASNVLSIQTSATPMHSPRDGAIAALQRGSETTITEGFHHSTLLEVNLELIFPLREPCKLPSNLISKKWCLVVNFYSETKRC